MSRYAAVTLFILTILPWGVGCSNDPGTQHIILLTIDTYRNDHFLTKKADVAVTPKLAANCGRLGERCERVVVFATFV